MGSSEGRVADLELDYGQQDEAVGDPVRRTVPSELRQVQEFEVSGPGPVAAQEMPEHERLPSSCHRSVIAKRFVQLERAFFLATQSVEVAVDRSQEAEVVVSIRDQPRFAELLRDRQPLFVQDARRGEVLHPVGQAAGGRQGTNPRLRSGLRRRMSQQLGQPRPAFAELRSLMPEPPDGAGNPHPDLRFPDRQRPAHGGPQVVPLVIDQVEPGLAPVLHQVRLGALGEIEEDARVAAFAARALGRLVEQLGGVLEDEGVAREARLAMIRRDDADQALVGEGFEGGHDVHAETAIRIGNGFGLVGGPAAAEDGESPEQSLLLGT